MPEKAGFVDGQVLHQRGELGLTLMAGQQTIVTVKGIESAYLQPAMQAVLEKVSGAALISARQRQARTAFLTGIVEQLIVDTKRARDTDAASLNMQLTTWRDGRAANDAFVAGTGDALRTWRQP